MYLVVVHSLLRHGVHAVCVKREVSVGGFARPPYRGSVRVAASGSVDGVFVY